MQKILILTAIPHGLHLDREIRIIEEAIRRAAKRELFEISIKTAVRIVDIRRSLAEERPQIVHFCGHGLEDGSLLLEDDEGNNKPVSPKGLAALFKLHTDYVNCVLLNSCYSIKLAEAIGEHISYTIGMNQAIGDKAAIIFAQGFYDGLGYDSGNIIQRAFDEGLVAIELEELADEQIPVLCHKIPSKDNKNFQLSSIESKNELNNFDIEILTDLLIRSGRTEYAARRTLCLKAGLELNQLSFLKQPADADFALELVSYLHNIDDKQALYKICKELERIFRNGKYAQQLKDVELKLNTK